MSAGGRLRVSVLQGKNLSLPSGEKYFVIAQMPDGGAKTSSIKTEAANKDNISSWNKSEVVEFSKELTGEMKFLFVLMEYGRIKDKAMGEASFDCSELISGGAHVVTTISFSPSSGGNALCEVSLDLSWDGDVPAYIAQQSIGSGGAGVTSTASGGAAAGSNGTVGGNAVVRGGGLAAQLPSPEGRSYSVRVMVRKAKNLQSENDNQLYDPLVCVSIGGETQKTDYQKKTNEPIFDDELMFMVNADAQFWSLPIKITVMHHRIGLPDDEIGGTQMEMQAVYRSNNHLMANKWFLLRRGGLSTQIMGFLKLTILVLDAMNDQIPEMEDDPEDGEESEDALIRNLVNTPGAQFEEIYLRCEMFRAQAIPQMDSFPGGLVGGNTADPFVKLTYGAKTARTSHILNTLSPKWNSAIMLPIQKPALIDSLMIQMYDYDGVGKDKLISTARLSIDEMKPLEGEQIGKSDEGLPRFYPRFVNFYGCPRSFYRDNPITSSIKPKYYQEMDKGLKEGVDFRGRLLCRFGGSRDKNCASEPITIQPKTAILHFTVVLQALQFSMLRKGKYTFQLTCGTADDQRPAAYANGKNTEDMRGDSSNLGAVFFGEEIRLDQSLEVVIPTPLVGQPTNFRTFVYNQFPDIFLHLMRDKDMYAVYRIKVSEIVGKEEAVLVCDAMRVMKDPEKNDEGEAPTDPLAQFCIGFMLKKVEKVKPEGLDKNASAAQQQQNADLELTADEIALLPTTETVRLKAISLGEPEKYALECCIHRGVNFPVGDPNGLSDPFIRISWANASAQSGVQLETLNPTYEELVLIRADARQPFTNLIVELWDWDLLGSNTFLAKAVVPQKYAAADAGEKVWLSNFTDHRGKPVEARLLCSFEFRKDVGQKYPDKIFQKKPGRNDTYRGLDIPDKKRLILSPHTITVSALSLRKMRPFRLLDVKNAQVSVAIGNTVIEFEKKKGLNPDINQTKTLVLDLPINCEFWPNLSVAVYDHRNFASKPRVGVASVPLIKLHKSEGGKQTTVENLYDPERKEAASKQQEVEVEERQKGIRRWRNEAFGDPLTIANDASISNMSPLNETGELTASYSIALRQRDADRAKREDKKSRKGRQGLDATEAAGDEEMEDSQNEEEVDEAEIALAVVQSDVEKKFVDKVDAEREKEEATKDKQVSKPSDIPWFERYDADETIEEKDFIVARLGKVHDYLCKQDRVRNYKGASEGTAEAYFGPFSDEGTRVPLLRGFTNKATKAGEITLDISIQATKGAKPTPEADKGAIVGEAIKSRQGVKFQMRAYLINCRHLAAVDHSIGGSSSDPYIVMTLNTGADGDKGAKGMKLSLVEYKKFKTLNPDYYHVQTMDGELPKQSNLLVEVFDYNDVMSDKLIGFTNINLEDRWYSCRGYQANRPYMQPGMYTEKRQLRDKSGQIQGTIELWIDMYPLTSIPHPIDITPPPPIEMELRTIIWQARDVMLEDMSLSGEPMVDIYVRAWMNGLRHDMQTTDVHYRSLDGSGTFNWRMNFQFLFDPRSKKIMPMAKKASSIAKWFRIRREQKTFDPIVKIQIFDNNLLPGTDNFIGEASLNLLKMRPVNNPRNKFSLLSEMLHDVKDVAKSFLCCKCCHRQPNIKDLSLEQRQIMAVKEFEQDCAARQKVFEEEAEERIKKLRALKGVYTEEQLANFRVKFIAEARAKAQINAFETFLPSARSKAKVGRHLKDVQELPPLTETAKYWFTARGPKGSGRVGDVQVSFQLVRLEALAKDEKLAAGKGRAEPQALPDPNRPDTSYFWLTSPFKAAAHIMWARFKWYILGLLAFLILCVFLYLFLKYGIKTESEKFFS